MSGTGNPARNNGGDLCLEISGPAVLAIQPRVSVRMRTYNHEPYVAQAIDGVLMQETDFPIELVIGDDCSTDQTREIVLRYQQKHPDIIRVVLWRQNVGAQRNARKLDELLRGEYIAFNDGDDYWTHPKKLQMQVDIMAANPDVGVVHGGVEMYNVATGKRHHWEPRPSGYDDGDIFNRYLNGKYRVSVPTACVRTRLYRAVRIDNPAEFDGRFLMADSPMWLELSRITKFRLINEPVATYTIRPGSISRPRDVQKEVRFWKSELEMYLHYVNKYNVDQATERHLRSSTAERFQGYLRRARGRSQADSVWEALKNAGADIGLKELILYWGAKCAFVRLGIEIAGGTKRALRRSRA